MDTVSFKPETMPNMPSDEDEGVADMDARLVGIQLTGDTMLVDNFDSVDDKQDAAIISPDGSVGDAEPELLADDCMWSRTPE